MALESEISFVTHVKEKESECVASVTLTPPLLLRDRKEIPAVC